MNFKHGSYVVIGAVWLLVATVVLFCTSSQAQIADNWLFKMDVQKSAVQTRFEFYRSKKSGSEKSPIKVVLVNMHAGDNPKATIWEIVAFDERRATSSIVYGVVPEGFRQTVPVDKSAPYLEAGKEDWDLPWAKAWR